MPVNVKVHNFEGPFDALLHLIKKNEMDIYDIRIYEITKQFLELIDEMKEIDLEVTSEFIVIAATLIEIKSKMLLPKGKNETAADMEDDPRNELVSKLVEYKKFKVAAQFLKSQEIGMMFSKKPEIIVDREYDIKDIIKDISMLQLYNLYNELIERYRSKINTENIIQRQIPLDSFKIEDKMETLKNKLYQYSKASFTNIMKECTSKIEVVVTFLAMLELIKLKEIRVVQHENFNEIYMERITINEES